jgi:hypothetical protein
MAVTNIPTAIRNPMCDAFVDWIDTGTTDATGDIKISTAAFSTLLVTNNFANPAFGAASVGVATAGAIANGTAVASGTAAVARLHNRDNTSGPELTVGTAAADVIISNTTIATNDIVSYTSGTITMPAS